jgi:predicted lactoylglutathione lyase
MSKMLFVNLPVADLAKSTAFYEALGLTKNPQFSDNASACMVLSETIFVMLLTHAKWSRFTSRPVAPAATSEVMLALTCESRAAVDALANAAAAHGGVADVDPPQDLGFMVNRHLADPDGHIWEAVWMDMAASGAPAEAAAS